MGKEHPDPGADIRLKRTERIFLMHRDLSLVSVVVLWDSVVVRRDGSLRDGPHANLPRIIALNARVVTRSEAPGTESCRPGRCGLFYIGAGVEPFNFESQPVQTIRQEMSYF